MTRNFPTTLLNLKNKVARHVLPDPRPPPLFINLSAHFTLLANLFTFVPSYDAISIVTL